MTERGVKEGALCSTSTRGEISRSLYAVARSGVCESAGDLAAMIKKCESTKKEQRDNRLRGKLKSQGNIRYTLKQYNDLLQFKQEQPDEYRKIEQRARTYLACREDHFSNKRVTTKVNQFKTNIGNDRAPNRFERLRGYTETESAQGKVRITKLKKALHERAIELELEARGIVFDTKELWTRKKQRLVEHEANTEEKRFFVLRTSLEAFADCH